MIERNSHPSFLELDRLVLRAERSPTTAEHVGGCERCSTYVKKIISNRRPVPNWAKNLSAKGKVHEFNRWLRWRWMGGLAGATAAVGLAVILAVMPSEKTDVITTKGTPAVGVYIKRNEKVALWDGRATVFPGDTLRLKVISAGFSHLTVLSSQRDDNVALVRLHDAPVIPEKETILPVAWKIDDHPGNEEIIVVLSHEDLPRELTAQEISVRSSESQNIWSTRLVLKKGTPSEE